MRIKALAIAVATVGLLGVPGFANAAPAAPSLVQSGISQQPEFLPVRDGCGHGFYLAEWRDQWGRWHRRCRPFQGGTGPWSGGGWGGPRGGPYGGPGWGGPYYR